MSSTLDCNPAKTSNASFERSLQRTVGDLTAPRVDTVSFCFLGTEPKEPYGPISHTAHLFLDILCQAAVVFDREKCWNISLSLFDVQAEEYPSSPEEWDRFDGIIMPGSFSTAYHTEDWILRYIQVIQNDIVKHQRKTLGVCFGHQILAHSYETGQAIRNPAGAHAGRYTMNCTPEGDRLLGHKKNIDLYYTHGDIVQTLPSCALRLGGIGTVPVQAAAYFSNETEVQLACTDGSEVKPFAITFQAHPEYAASRDLGLDRTLKRTMSAMHNLNNISNVSYNEASQDAIEKYETVHQDSLDVIIQTASLLGWFCK